MNVKSDPDWGVLCEYVKHVGMLRGYCLLLVVKVEGMSQDSVRAFTRTFIATPISNYR